MIDSSLLNRYAIALLSLAIENNNVEEKRKEVKEITDILYENIEFSDVLASANLDLNEKYAIIDDVFKSASEDIKSFIKIIVRNNRSQLLPKIFKETLYRFDDYLHIEEGTLYLAKETSDKEIEKILKGVEKAEGVRIEADIKIDPTLIGGFIVELRNNVYDSSIRTKLKNLKTNLKDGGN